MISEHRGHNNSFGVTFRSAGSDCRYFWLCIHSSIYHCVDFWHGVCVLCIRILPCSWETFVHCNKVCFWYPMIPLDRLWLWCRVFVPAVIDIMTRFSTYVADITCMRSLVLWFSWFLSIIHVTMKFFSRLIKCHHDLVILTYVHFINWCHQIGIWEPTSILVWVFSSHDYISTILFLQN